ncbi:REP15 protein, partial [Heliornis fulica]|nr:REP15 protein [Heliornis fulica]
EVFSQGEVYASPLFVAPRTRFQPATKMLSEILLVDFMSFCMEQGMEEHTMTKQQSSLFGVDCLWSQQADQAPDLGAGAAAECWHSPAEVVVRLWPCQQTSTSETRSRFEKLAELCCLVGQDCLGLLIVLGVPGKPKDPDSIAKEGQKYHLWGRTVLRQFVTGTDSLLPMRDMLAKCLSTYKGWKGVSNVHINSV